MRIIDDPSSACPEERVDRAAKTPGQGFLLHQGKTDLHADSTTKSTRRDTVQKVSFRAGRPAGPCGTQMMYLALNCGRQLGRHLSCKYVRISGTSAERRRWMQRNCGSLQVLQNWAA